jgi:hypothetical protein
MACVALASKQLQFSFALPAKYISLHTAPQATKIWIYELKYLLTLITRWQAGVWLV